MDNGQCEQQASGEKGVLVRRDNYMLIKEKKREAGG